MSTHREDVPVKSAKMSFVACAGRAKDKRGVDLTSDALPFGRLWYGEPQAISYAIGYAKF
jgi:hypothetical protein